MERKQVKKVAIDVCLIYFVVTTAISAVSRYFPVIFVKGFKFEMLFNWYTVTFLIPLIIIFLLLAFSIKLKKSISNDLVKPVVFYVSGILLILSAFIGISGVSFNIITSLQEVFRVKDQMSSAVDAYLKSIYSNIATIGLRIIQILIGIVLFNDVTSYQKGFKCNRASKLKKVYFI